MVNEEHVIEGTNRTGKSATIFWPGSMSSYDGKWPFFAFKKYNKTYSTRLVSLNEQNEFSAF